MRFRNTGQIKNVTYSTVYKQHETGREFDVLLIKKIVFII